MSSVYSYNIGVVSFKVVMPLSNVCRFAWKIPGADAAIVKVEPSMGTILPNENQFHTFAFSPNDEIKYVVRAKLFAVGSAQ